MNTEEIRRAIRTILVSILKHDNLEMTDDLSARDVDGWDSLSHMVIISEIENHFGVKFKLRELNKLNNLGNLIELVSGKIDQK